MDDEVLREQVRACLAGYGGEARAEVKGGRVTLMGKVPSWFDADEAERQVWAIDGVQAVDNRLTYAEGTATAEAESAP